MKNYFKGFLSVLDVCASFLCLVILTANIVVLSFASFSLAKSLSAAVIFLLFAVIAQHFVKSTISLLGKLKDK